MIMHHYAIYEADTGKVVSAGKSSNPRIIDLARERMADGEALYVGEIDPRTTFLPGGVPTPKPEEVRVVSVQDVKAHAGRLLSYTDWYVTRHAETGAPIPEDVLAYREAVRAMSNEIESMDPIPSDFQDPKYWLAHL